MIIIEEITNFLWQEVQHEQTELVEWIKTKELEKEKKKIKKRAFKEWLKKEREKKKLWKT